MSAKRILAWFRRHSLVVAEYKAEIERLEEHLAMVQLVADQRAESYLQMRKLRDEAYCERDEAVKARDEARQRQDERLDAVVVEINRLAVDLHAISIGAKPPSGRPLTWAGDIESALRGVLDGAVV